MSRWSSEERKASASQPGRGFARAPVAADGPHLHPQSGGDDGVVPVHEGLSRETWTPPLKDRPGFSFLLVFALDFRGRLIGCMTSPAATAVGCVTGSTGGSPGDATCGVRWSTSPGMSTMAGLTSPTLASASDLSCAAVGKPGRTTAEGGPGWTMHLAGSGDLTLAWTGDRAGGGLSHPKKRAMALSMGEPQLREVRVSASDTVTPNPAWTPWPDWPCMSSRICRPHRELALIRRESGQHRDPRHPGSGSGFGPRRGWIPKLLLASHLEQIVNVLS